MSTDILKGRNFYKPFDYPEFYDMWKKHERSHWLPSEVSFVDDINDWSNKLTKQHKDFLTNLFRFFTQADVDVAGAYCKQYLPNFSQTPEIAMFLCSVAAREAVHIDAYSHLIETLGIPESTYKEFLMYDEMRQKQDFLLKYQNVNYGYIGNYMYELTAFFIIIILLCFCGPVYVCFAPLAGLILSQVYNKRQSMIKEHIACSIALFSGFTEGMQLFSSFTMLLSFPLNGLMKGMGQIISWSLIDETQHTEGMIKLFKIFVNENSKQFCKCYTLFGCSCLRKDIIKRNTVNIGMKMVELEDAFIDLAYKDFSTDEIFMGISKTSLKNYIRYIANKRLESLGCDKIFKINKNPLPEFEIMINAPIQTNFFENRNTDYSKGFNIDWNSVWNKN